MKTRRIVLCVGVALTAIALPGSVATGALEPDYQVTDGANDKLLVKGTDADNDLVVLYGNQGGTARFGLSVETGHAIVESSTHCSPSDFFPQQIVYCDYDLSGFVLKQGAGNDKNHFFPDGSDQPWPAAVKLVVNGGAGNDSVRGGNGDDVVKGSTGKDKLMGLNGFDRLRAKDGAKDSEINCGKGDDPNPKVDPIDPDPTNC